LSLVGAANLSAGKRLVAKIVFSLQTPVGVLTLASLGPIKRLIAIVFLFLFVSSRRGEKQDR
jgi:hypothetical protein